MAESVYYSSVRESSDKERQIIIITLRPSVKGEILFDNHYCHYLPPKEIIYKLHYLQLSEPNDRGRLIKFILENAALFDNTSNELFIYSEYDPALEALFANILQAFENFELKKTVYLEGVEEGEIIAKYKKFFIRYNFVSYHTSNIIAEVPAGQYTKETPSGLKHTVVLSKAKNNKLTCQPWLKKFLSRVFSCGVYRLIQKSGTCYLNATINGILLSEDVRNLFLQKLDDFVSQYPESKAYISRPLSQTDMTSCKVFQGVFFNEIQYLYRILYNSLCKPIRPFPRVGNIERKDVFESASREYFSPTSSGFGGTSIATILIFLLGSEIDFLLALEDKEKLIYINPRGVLDNIDTNFSVVDVYSTYYERLVANRTRKRISREVILYLPRDNWIKPQHIDDIKTFDFEPQIGLLYFNFTDMSQNESVGHDVTLFFCDGVPKVYDSAENFIFEADWLGDKQTFLQSYEDHNKTYYPQEIILSKYSLDFVLFSKTNVQKASCFQLSAELEASWITEMEKEYTWNIPMHRLYKQDSFTPYFYKLIEIKQPITENFFDPFHNQIAGKINDKYDLVKLILQTYPEIQFTVYPELAQIIFQNSLPQNQLEYSGITIKDYDQLITLHKDIILYGIKTHIPDEVKEEAARKGNSQIVVMLEAIP